MAAVRIDNFGGLVLTKDQKKGPFWTAMKCQNCDVQSGSIDISYALDLANAQPLSGSVGRKSIYHITGSTFLEWTQVVDVARSPLADNSSHRIYYTGAGVPQVTDASMAAAGAAPFPATSFVLGLPIFPQLLTVQEFAGSTAQAETRAYTYTWLSPWGEESAPSSPVTVATKVSNVQINVGGMGVTTRGFSGATPSGFGVSVTYVAGPPGVTRCSMLVAGFATDFRVGDRCYLFANGTLNDQRIGSYIVGAVDTTGNGSVDLVGNISDIVVGPSSFFIMRVAPVNTYNIVAVAINSPSTGQCQIFVDTVEGLRAGEDVAISGTGGIPGLNATFTVATVSASSTDPLINPYFVITLATSGALTGAATSVAARTARHNTADTRILALSFAGGVVTATVESTAHMNAGDSVVVVAALGAWQANGKRKISAVLNGTTFTFPLSAMSAYTGGGRVMLNTPNAMPELGVTAVTVSGASAPFTVQIATSAPPNAVFAPGDLVLGYEIGGSVELDNVMRVHAVTAGYIEVFSNVAPTAYTSGGKVLNLKSQSRKRLYRTGTGTSGTAEYQLVAELSGDRAYFIDTVETAGLGDVLESDEYIQPPVDMKSIVAHPGGFLMGISGNVICKSVPYQPHAWPLSLQQSLPADGVAMGIYGTTAVAMTNVIPFNVTGYDPGSMRIERQDVGEPCTAQRSVVATGLGVSYRGTSGIFLIGYDGSENATRNYLPPALFLSAADTIAAYWGNKLIWIDAGTQSGFIFDPVREDKGLTEFSLDYPVYGLHVSPIDGKLYASYLDGSTPKRAPLFTIVTAPAKFTYWTQYILLPRPVNLAFLQADWAWGTQSKVMKSREDLLARNVRARPLRGRQAVGLAYVGQFELAGDDLELAPTPDRSLSVPTEIYLHVTVIANPDRPDVAVTVFDDYVVNELPVGMAEGVEADTWQIKIEGNAKVTAVSLAETLEELGEA